MSILFGRGTNFIFETDDTKSVESTCHKKNHCVLMCSRLVSGMTSVSAVGLPCMYLYFVWYGIGTNFVWFQETVVWVGILSRAYGMGGGGANSSRESCHYNLSNLTAWEHKQIWSCIKTRENSWQKKIWRKNTVANAHMKGFGAGKWRDIETQSRITF